MALNQSELLSPVADDVELILHIVALINEEDYFVVRADFAIELVRDVAMLEDTLERALYDSLAEFGYEDLADRLRLSGEQVRAAMQPVHEALHNSVPVDVHLHRPERLFDEDLERLCAQVTDHLASTMSRLTTISGRLTNEQRTMLHDRLQSARRSATARPRSPHNPLARLFFRVIDNVDHRLGDTSAQWHPGRNRLSEELEGPVKSGT